MLNSTPGMNAYEAFEKWKLFTSEAAALCWLENSVLIIVFWVDYSVVTILPFLVWNEYWMS
jgi:hypothetical protein